MMNRAISAIKSAWYATERPRLFLARSGYPGFWGGDPLVSVVIPTHNRADLLKTRALSSALNQTYDNLEILVCAHGCTDATHDLVQAIDDPRVRLIPVKRVKRYPPTAENHWLAGPVDPINAGLAAAKGAWIARLDDDDTWTASHVAQLLRFAQANDYEFVSAAHNGGRGKVDPYLVRGARVGGVQTWLYRSYLRFFRANIDCWRKDWNRVNDVDLQDRMARAGVRMGYLDDVVAEVLPRPGETATGSKAYTTDPAKAERLLAFD